MKAILASAAALALVASAGAASAQAPSRSVDVNGTVDRQCGVGNHSGGGNQGHTPTLTISDMTDADGFLDTTTTHAIGFGNVWCNGAATLTLTASALTHDTITGGFDARSFTNSVDMEVSAGAYGNRSILLYFGNGVATTTQPLSRPTTGAFETGGDDFQRASVRLVRPADSDGGNDRPLAGDYSGTITLTASVS